MENETDWKEIIEGYLQVALNWLKHAVSGESWPEFLLVFFLGSIVFVAVCLTLFQMVWLARTRSPVATHPPGWPSSSKYQVCIEHHMPMDFTWSFPYLLCEGGKYNMADGARLPDSDNLFELPSGTRVRFVLKPVPAIPAKNSPQ